MKTKSWKTALQKLQGEAVPTPRFGAGTLANLVPTLGGGRLWFIWSSPATSKPELRVKVYDWRGEWCKDICVGAASLHKQAKKLSLALPRTILNLG